MMAARSLFVTLAALVLALVSSLPAFAERLVSAISAEEVKISSNFTGADILVFGEIGRDAATVPRPGKYDIVVTVEGPPEQVTTWRKERVFGLWINVNSKTYANVPSFYAAHSSSPLEEVSPDNILKQERTGLDNLPIAPVGIRFTNKEEREAFREAFLRERVEDGLYAERFDAVEFLSPTLFATNVPLPANIPTGTFTVTTFLYKDGVKLSEVEQTLSVAKTGFEQLTYSLAYEQPALYGIMAVILALFTGWMAGIIFRKN
ncbi:hypothetical protein E1162_16300 [Rhodobacteraceae bacterium RKSG542]|uniref:TIGR02186 family protein n=1 Tax=Pseudovibrio flavus TaxID=2529854 RepID=UPI0012BD33EA|nr:TIGR02186 family protein [Pseudovibrio flavus]MTI18809.1 hypothetical protein [Pseudovibrio flavus]